MQSQIEDLNPIHDLALMISKIIREGKCFWSNKQTIASVLDCLEEECRELFDALYFGDKKEIISEIGDILGLSLMLCCIAEREGICSAGEPAVEENSKIRRRSPYVFNASLIIKSPEEAEALWQASKARERNEESLKISLPVASRWSTFALANHMLENCLNDDTYLIPNFDSEEELGRLLYQIFRQSKEKNLDPEKALRKFLLSYLNNVSDSPLFENK